MKDKKYTEKLIKYFGYKFRESEAVQVIITSNKELRFEIGQLKSYINELEHDNVQLKAKIPVESDPIFEIEEELTKAESKKVNKIINDLNIRVSKIKLKFTNRIDNLNDQNRKLRRENERLLMKLAQMQTPIKLN